MRLAAIRKSKKLSQEQLGELIGRDQATIQRAEKMHRSARLETYIACADALGVSLDDLFSSERSDQENLLILRFRASNGQAQSLLMAMALEAAGQNDAPDVQDG